MQKLHNLALRAENAVYSFLDLQMPVLHTAFQAAFGALIAGLVVSRSSADVKLAVGAAVAVFLASLKAAFLNYRG